MLHAIRYLLPLVVAIARSVTFPLVISLTVLLVTLACAFTVAITSAIAGSLVSLTTITRIITRAIAGAGSAISFRSLVAAPGRAIIRATIVLAE